MDWGLLVGASLLLAVVILVLRLVWHVMIALVLLGPPAIAGLAAGSWVQERSQDFVLSMATAALVSGLLLKLAGYVLNFLRGA